MSNSSIVLSARGLRKTYTSGPQHVTVWENVDLDLYAGESIAIVGASGSGKTSLLNALGGLDSVDAGAIEIAGHKLNDLNDKQRTQLRNRDIGFVYQFHHLLPEFTALENVMLPQLIAGVSRSDAKKRAEECLAQLGLAARGSHKPAELSGGERQRTAIARALVNKPKLVLLDEPTGNLDQDTAKQVELVMDELRNSVDTAFVTVTHDIELAGRMQRRFRLLDKQLHIL